ncbi:MBL fold metallo-hydrolase [Aureimonas sp. SK2]|uniref:MBL fold metallo-hydrolase n=1 Tax=Aureimonas sp. SK2 TaxID=3015992 RepID=UPI002444C2E7|nr:MBL fold metallo-hydrolase [Aureimonas sp. SK2]
MSYHPIVAGFHDPRTSSIQYVVSCPATRRCAIIDPVLDFDEKSGSIAATNADALLDYVERQNLRVEWILDTHPHADHFSAAYHLSERTGAPIAIGERIVEVQRLWQDIYGWPELATDGSQWDRLLKAGDTLSIGEMTVRVLHSPGHTLASVTYVVGDAAFIHDTLFMPDSGSARADFPGGSAASLWRSIRDIVALPDATRLFVGHDYQPDGREPRWQSSVAEQRTSNKHLSEISSEDEFVAMREERDRTLPLPKLMLAALQVNLRGGRLPEPNHRGDRYLRIPLNAFADAPWDAS